MSTETLDSLLRNDIDDLTALACDARSDERNALLAVAATALVRGRTPSRLKLIRFVQALAATTDAPLRPHAGEAVLAPLITATHSADAVERLAALRALAVVAAHTEAPNAALMHSILTAFEHARLDADAEIRAFAGEILSAGNPVFSQLSYL